MLRNDQAQAVREYASRDPNIAAVYLFGSEASGRARKGSDVDLSVVLREPVEGFRRIRMETELSQAIGRDVDLVVFHEGSILFKRQILKARRLLYEGDRRERVRQETAARYEYLDTRFLHREIGGPRHD